MKGSLQKMLQLHSLRTTLEPGRRFIDRELVVVQDEVEDDSKIGIQTIAILSEGQ
jgi:hypothetical protein